MYYNFKRFYYLLQACIFEITWIFMFSEFYSQKFDFFINQLIIKLRFFHRVILVKLAMEQHRHLEPLGVVMEILDDHLMVKMLPFNHLEAVVAAGAEFHLQGTFKSFLYINFIQISWITRPKWNARVNFVF